MGRDKFFLNATKFRGDEFPESFDMSTDGRSVTRIEAGEQSGNEGNGDGNGNSGTEPDNAHNGNWSTNNSWDETAGMATDPNGHGIINDANNPDDPIVITPDPD